MPAPLDDVVVLEIDNWMAAPSAGAVLADMGARVIKIEPITGDPMRGMGRPVKGERVAEALQDYDFQFDVDNRGKETNPHANQHPHPPQQVRQHANQPDNKHTN
ncbi:MAG: CoA transferase, partial [Gammaproteobacteria bacterium]